ncbi:MAG: mechanosensitive ion channel family protein [Bacteroidota bacterium]
MDLNAFISQIPPWVIDLAINLGKALATLVIGLWLVKRVAYVLNKSMERASVGAEIRQFLMSMIDISLKILVVLIAGSFVGLEISAIVGMLAAAGFAIGLALQGFLGNFAAGITIVFFKPYRVGDWVEISEKFGKVESIQIFNTTIITPGRKTLIIPNGQVTDNIITNFSTQGKIRLELEVPIAYESSFPAIRNIIMEALKDCPFILQDPPPEIGILAYDSHNVVLQVRPFIIPDEYWNATFEVNKRIKNAFHLHNIPVAYSEGIELGKIGE